jgi:hypothetical protein
MLAIDERIDIQKVSSEEVLRYLGYQAGHKVPTRILSLVDKHIQNAAQLIEPQHSFIIRDVEHIEGDRAFLGDVAFEGRILAQLMQRCKKAAIFAVTIGDLLEGQVQQLANQGRVLEAAIMDAVGSDAAEKAATSVQDRVREMAGAQSLGISFRFSPGYCDWDIGQQKMVFCAMNGRSAGIRLTEGCVMVPRKSVSGIIGMSPHGGELERWSPCKSCRQRNCPGRR